MLLVVSIYVNYRSEDFEFLLWLRGKMALMVYISIAGIILYFINLLLTGLDGRTHAKEKEALEQEVNALKAKMFDLQEATGSKSTPKSSAVVEEEVDDSDSDSE